MVSASEGSSAFRKGNLKSLVIQGSTKTTIMAGPASSTVSMYLWLSESVSISPNAFPKAGEVRTSMVKY